MMEAFAKRGRKALPKIITCPDEFVALSMADGFARVTNEPQCVIVHVDVGTQGLAGAMHNASRGRVPVLIFAGLSPCTIEGEIKGSRNEFIHWLQDVPDQKEIARQYCRYVTEIKTGRNVKQMANRALQFATSDPKGPVYMYATREVMEEEVSYTSLDQRTWQPTSAIPLPSEGVELIAHAVVHAQSPLLLLGYSGRKPASVASVVSLANRVPRLRVLDTGGSDMCFPANHPASLGFSYGVHESIETADFILVVDCDVPWIPLACHPRPDAHIIHVDLDPLKQQINVFYIPARQRYQADSATALKQLTVYLRDQKELLSILESEPHKRAELRRVRCHSDRIHSIREMALIPSNPRDVPISPHVLISQSWLNSGGSGLGWSGGGALGARLASDFKARAEGGVSGKIPMLTVVLNNGGWNAPRNSMLLLHPHGHGSQVTNESLHISFKPNPKYAEIANAASGGHARSVSVSTVEQLLEELPGAIEQVTNGGISVLDVQLDFKDGNAKL
uniref:Benzoylformate decarboxylase n=1 Tax=Talaromyces marneffei PM1 TaxID=1077442 RepID=A0A093V3V8_TALMA